VQITPTPDLSWEQWRSSQDIYKDFLDKIGSIENVVEDDDRPGEHLYAVRVNFPDGLGHMGPGHYYEWFRADHLIRSSESNAKLRDNMYIAGKELQEWEKFKKKSTDDILRKIFVPEEKKEEIPSKSKRDDPNQWDLKTHSDDYDTYYDDGYYPDYNSSRPVYQYDNKTDLDYYYYSDISNVKVDDKD